MNLAHYITAKPYPVTHGRIVLGGEPINNDALPPSLAAHHAIRSAMYERQVLDSMTDEMTVTAICKATGFGDQSVRRILARLKSRKQVAMRLISNNKQIWSKT